MIERTWMKRARVPALALGVALCVAACSKADEPKKAEAPGTPTTPSTPAPFDSSKLPRMPGGKEIFASPPQTIFTSTQPVAETADSIGKALAAAGWQSYVAPNAGQVADPNIRLMSLKKGPQGLGVVINVAPAQNNATSVSYMAVELKNDLPFPKDAADIAYDPTRPLLLLSTAGPVDATLDFYRKALGPLGWSLWSQRRNAAQPDGGAAGEPTKKGAHAYYLRDNTQLAMLEIERDDAGRSKVKFEGLPASKLAELQDTWRRSDNAGVAQADMSTLPRLDGAVINAERSTSGSVVYSVPGSVKDTAAATRKMLEAAGWKEFVAPLDAHDTLLFFKKGRYAATVSFTQTMGRPDQSSVYYSPTWLVHALAVPADATDLVFDTNRPYLNAVTAGTPEATLEFYRTELADSGWTPLSAADIAAQWPNAKPDDPAAPGTRVYFARGKQRPILLTVAKRDDNKTAIEIRVPVFAEPQVALDGDVFGLPKPKPMKTAGGQGGATQHSMHATVPAQREAVLEFYRKELASRGWKEDAQGVVASAGESVLNFTSPEGPAVLRLGYRYDLTTVSLVQQLPKREAPKPEAASKPSDMLADAMKDMKDMQQMLRDAGAMTAPAPPAAPASRGTDAPLRKLAGNAAPIPVPDNAVDVEFDGGAGSLEFSSPSSPTAVADFYRGAMKEQGMSGGSSVINNANMVQLNFAGRGKSVALTIMRMGPKTNVQATGSALQVASAGAAASSKAAKADAPSPPATADDLTPEEFGGLPAPKRHTMTEGTQTPFRRELKASVPLSLDDVLGFYRRELGKLNWKEDGKAAVTADSAVVAWAAPEGPAVLRLGRKDGETSVSLMAKNPGAAAKDGVLPKPGQARVLFGNINDAAATITFNNKPLSVAAGAGTKKPDGPTLDVAPGKYRYSLKLPGKPAANDEVVLGADETWGLMIGPGGVLALQAY